MEKFNVQTYIYFLKSEYKELLAEHCLEQLSKHPRVADVKIEYEKVVKSMTDLVRISVCPATCSGFIRPGVSV